MENFTTSWLLHNRAQVIHVTIAWYSSLRAGDRLSASSLFVGRGDATAERRKSITAERRTQSKTRTQPQQRNKKQHQKKREKEKKKKKIERSKHDITDMNQMNNNYDKGLPNTNHVHNLRRSTMARYIAEHGNSRRSLHSRFALGRLQRNA